jgi:hypothetical protein
MALSVFVWAPTPVASAAPRPVSGPIGSGDRAGVAAADRLALYAPGDDSLGVDADQRSRLRDRLGVAADLDPPWPPGVSARQIVDHDRGAPRPLDVAVLLRTSEIVSADVDPIVLRVVGSHPHRHDVGCAVRADGRKTGESPLPGHVLELGTGERAHAFLDRCSRIVRPPQPAYGAAAVDLVAPRPATFCHVLFRSAADRCGELR